MVVLIPKKDGGLRPIALFRSLYRLYSRARSPAAAAWAATHGEGSLCSNASGRWAGDSTWRHQIRAVLQGTPSHRLDIMLDLQKAFERVPHTHLIQAARQASYPMHLLATSLVAYHWPRRLQYQSAVSDPIYPTRGIAAGSTTATYELWLDLRPCLLRIAAISPSVQPTLFVDDLSLHVQHADEVETLALALQAASLAKRTIEDELGMKFAGDKGCIVASSSTLARLAAQHICLQAEAADSVRRLGVDYHLQSVASSRTDQLTTHWARVASARARTRKLLRTFPGGAPGIFVAGILPHALHGVEHYAPSDKHVLHLRRAAV